MTEQTKRCSKCNKRKPVSEFHQKRPTSHDTRCKTCMSRYSRSRYTDDTRRTITNNKRLLKERGLCVSCGKAPISPEVSTVRCAECLKRSRLSHAKQRAKARETLFHVYGGPVCACCGQDERRFLSFDHINNDGADHRLSIGKRSNGGGFSDVVSLNRALKKASYPPIIQVLCFNCNFGKYLNGGVCPHKERKP